MLKQRVITALILAPLVLCGVFLLADIYFAVFVGLFVVTGGWEWAGLAGLHGAGRLTYAASVAGLLLVTWYVPPAIVLSLGCLWWTLAIYLVLRYPGSNRLWQHPWLRYGIGLLILVPAWTGLNWLKASPDGDYYILTLLLLIWSADIGAYFCGKALGKRKLAPSVSPGKTWEGAMGGLVFAAVMLIGLEFYTGRLAGPPATWWQYFIGCMVVIFISVTGDLTESMFKT